VIVTLGAGETLLHYRLVEKLGEGGMGVVWKAVDTSLDREVAVKVLPEHFAQHPDRLARFEREAKSLATLNDSRIAQVFGLHESNGLRFLAMELVGGEDLAARLRRGPLPVDEALEVAHQVAEALETAHESGIVHRDLKPANVVLSPEGKAKVLDFGLAKVIELDPMSGDSNSSMSPTATSAGTVAGGLMGTVAYMSPEQARGKPVDRRTDVWAFGCLLYEMLTGKKAFGGETPSDTVAAILRSEADESALPEAIDGRIRRLLRRCFRKDPRRRLRDMGDARILLEETLVDEPEDARPEATLVETRSPWRERAGWIALSTLFLAAVAVMAWRGTGEGEGTGRSESAAPVIGMEQLTDLPGMIRSPNLSPDGRQLLYEAEEGGDNDIFLQRVGGEKAINLTAESKEDDFAPAFSPDGEHIAFCSSREGGGIFVMGATGESPRRVTDGGFHPAWSPDGTRLVYTTERLFDAYGRLTSAQLWIVELESGETTLLHAGDAVDPVWSPDSGRIAFWAALKGQRDIWIVPSGGGESIAVTEDAHTDWNPIWSEDGEALYFISDRGGSPDLWRIEIDWETGRAQGEPRPVTAGIASVREATVSADGRRLAFTVWKTTSLISRSDFDPVALRPRGEMKTIHSSSKAIVQADLSPDGQWLAFRTSSPRETLSVIQVDGSGRRKLVDDAHRNRGPRWSPDGQWLLFYSNRGGDYELWAMRADGTSPRQLTETQGIDLTNPTWSPDGRLVATHQTGENRQATVLYRVDDDLDRVATPLSAEETEIQDFTPDSWSPDGRRIAGAALDPAGGFSVAVHDLETGTTELLDSDESRYFWTSNEGTPWLDAKRFAFWDERTHSAYVWDVESRTHSPIPGIPGPGGIHFGEDGRSVIVTSLKLESDVWMLTLGGDGEIGQ
jgi:Tol biopolymer transport system component/serine/threonine protein kinase